MEFGFERKDIYRQRKTTENSDNAVIGTSDYLTNKDKLLKGCSP